MSRLGWDNNEPRTDGGVDHGVLYLTEGVFPWNGLVRVEEKDDAALAYQYYDGRGYRVSQSLGSFTATMEAMTYPREFEPYTGLDDIFGQQPRKRFGLSYQTGFDESRQIHLIWGAKASPNLVAMQSLTNVASPDTFSWELNTVPDQINETLHASHLMIDLGEVRYPEAWDELDAILYGTASQAPRLPSQSEVVELFESHTIFRVTYHGDGTWTATGPSAWVKDNGDGTYEITSPTAYQIDEDTHVLSSY